MKLKLIACTAQRPDNRAIITCLDTIAIQNTGLSSQELTAILLEGDAVKIEIANKNTSSGLRALRKLEIDYEILD